MPEEELLHEIEAGVRFWGAENGGRLVAVMGIQHVGHVSLVRQAYVRTADRRQGFGSRLLEALRMQASKPLLVGTWAAASWAIRFYERHGFRLVTPEEKDRLLRTYWTISDRQIETSVVLADGRWIERQAEGRNPRP